MDNLSIIILTKIKLGVCFRIPRAIHPGTAGARSSPDPVPCTRLIMGGLYIVQGI